MIFQTKLARSICIRQAGVNPAKIRYRINILDNTVALSHLVTAKAKQPNAAVPDRRKRVDRVTIKSIIRVQMHHLELVNTASLNSQTPAQNRSKVGICVSVSVSARSHCCLSCQVMLICPDRRGGNRLNIGQSQSAASFSGAWFFLLPLFTVSWLSNSFRWQLYVVAKPVKALENAFAGCCAAGLDLPDVVSCGVVQVKGVGDFIWFHG